MWLHQSFLLTLDKQLFLLKRTSSKFCFANFWLCEAALNLISNQIPHVPWKSEPSLFPISYTTESHPTVGCCSQHTQRTGFRIKVKQRSWSTMDLSDKNKWEVISFLCAQSAHNLKGLKEIFTTFSRNASFLSKLSYSWLWFLWELLYNLYCSLFERY